MEVSPYGTLCLHTLPSIATDKAFANQSTTAAGVDGVEGLFSMGTADVDSAENITAMDTKFIDNANE